MNKNIGILMCLVLLSLVSCKTSASSRLSSLESFSSLTNASSDSDSFLMEATFEPSKEEDSGSSSELFESSLDSNGFSESSASNLIDVYEELKQFVLANCKDPLLGYAFEDGGKEYTMLANEDGSFEFAESATIDELSCDLKITSAKENNVWNKELNASFVRGGVLITPLKLSLMD